MRRAPHSGRRSRAGAVLLVLTLALGQLGAMLHAAELHARCAEHGELIHADGDQGEGPARGVAAWLEGLSRTADAGELRGLPAAGEHEHDHCLATCAARDRALAPNDSDVDATRLSARQVAVRAHAERAAARPLYRTAPKNSPPV